MKKLSYLFILPLCLMASSCTMMVKGIAKLAVKDYNDYTHTNISNIQLIDAKGNKKQFNNLFTGKTVYLYAWDNKRLSAAQEKSYRLLQDRFAKYPDVVFANLNIGSDTASNAFKLADDASSAEFRKTLKINDPASLIIGKDGSILAYKGPKPDDKIVVDYVLYEARNGVNGTKSAKRLIKGVNKHEKFKTDQLRDWYSTHFSKSPDDKLSFSISTTN